jgi:PIN domain nuclease of toxin-antitoxin system
VGRDEVILLDTHAAIWFATDGDRLGPISRDLADQALGDEQLVVSSISFWEIALLVSKSLAGFEETTRTRKIAIRAATRLIDAGITELPVTGPISILAAELPNLHGDSADRFIAATSVIHGATFMTADAELLRWPHVVQRQDASK